MVLSHLFSLFNNQVLRECSRNSKKEKKRKEDEWTLPKAVI
jgi:hypothetical protein